MASGNVEVQIWNTFVTVNVKLCIASPSPFTPVMVTGKVPDWVGVPDSSPELASVTPFGRDPVSVKVDAGKPLAVNAKVPA